MARKVNKYVIPETRGNVTTRKGAIKRIRETYEANKDLIDQRFWDEAAQTGGRPPKDYYKAFEDNVLQNLHHSFGGDQTSDKIWKDGRYVEEKLRINEALVKSLNNSLFTPYKDRARMNLIKGLKKNDPDGYREITRRLGKAPTYEDIQFLSDTGEYSIALPGGIQLFITADSEQGRYGFHVFDPNV